MRQGILVEFVGVPGVGKSTLARTVVKRLRRYEVGVGETNLPVMAKHRWRVAANRAALAGRFVLRAPTLATRSVSDILATRQHRLDDLRSVTVNWLCKCELMTRARCSRDVQVSDEGVLHAIWSIGYSAHDSTALGDGVIESICSLLPTIWIVIAVEARGSVASQRLLRRPGRLNRLARDSRHGNGLPSLRATSSLQSARVILDRVIHRAPSADIRIVSVKNDLETDLAPNADLICQHVMEVL